MTNYIERYWRDAKPEDAIKEPPMVARFKDEEDDEWSNVSILSGWDRFSMPWYDSEATFYRFCQVYDVPDPGEGWRLIDVEKEERVPSDELWHPGFQKWLSPEDCYSYHYEKSVYYRRRIEQPKPKYVPFEWEDREQLRGRWIVDGAGDEQCIIRLDQYQEVLIINDNPADKALEEWNFADTGKPVGKRVQ